MKFVRLGGLSAVDYKGLDKKLKDHEKWHSPPKRKGIYAFIWPYIETYLCIFGEDKPRELKHKGFRKFDYTGLIFCHFSDTDNWVEVHTDQLKILLNKHKHDLIKRGENWQYCDDPFKRGRGGWYSKDILEVFIEAKHLNKIK